MPTVHNIRKSDIVLQAEVQQGVVLKVRVVDKLLGGVSGRGHWGIDNKRVRGSHGGKADKSINQHIETDKAGGLAVANEGPTREGLLQRSTVDIFLQSSALHR